MVLLKDLPTWFEGNPALVRGVRDLYYRLKNGRDVVFLSCPLLKLPEILKKEVFLIEVDLPSEEEVLEQLEVVTGASEVSREQLFRLAAGMRGLSLNEVGHLSARLFRGKPMPEAEMLAEIQEEKGQILRKESCLQFYPPQRSLDDIGGLENLKDWVRTRADLFTEKAWRDDVPLPAGVLFMGVSGCGKSMAAKAIATAWGLPLVRLDMSLVLSGSFGTPEYAFARATRIADRQCEHLLQFSDLAAGEVAPGVRGGHREPHPAAPGGTDAQGSVRPAVLPRPAAGGGAQGDPAHPRRALWRKHRGLQPELHGGQYRGLERGRD